MPFSAIIIGAGPGVGRHVGEKLLKEGWKVALGSRSLDFPAAKADGFHGFKIDVTSSDTIIPTLEGVQDALGAPPNVIIYNAYAFPRADSSDPLSIPLSDLKSVGESAINSVYEAARFAVAGFAKLPSSAPKVFIFTGNALPFLPAIPQYFTLGIGKISSAYIIATLNNVYADKGYQFYFATQIKSDLTLLAGSEFGPEPHVSAYWELIQRKKQGNWDARFTIEGKILD